MKLDIFFPIFLLLIIHEIYGNTSDYFTGKYDPGRNCLEEDLMKNLTKESFPRCAAVIEGRIIVDKSRMLNCSGDIYQLKNFVFKGDENLQWENCKEKLSQIITLKCRGFGLDKVRYLEDYHDI